MSKRGVAASKKLRWLREVAEFGTPKAEIFLYFNQPDGKRRPRSRQSKFRCSNPAHHRPHSRLGP